jgi:predicted enzyme related to lactoylglutathione lyase
MSTPTATQGPDFISFQVRDLHASADFYEHTLGLTRLPAANPQAVVFADGPVAFAVRNPFPGVDLDALGRLGAGIGVWFHCQDAHALHRKLEEAGVTIVQEPFDGPFGVTFSLLDPDGYTVTMHDKA